MKRRAARTDANQEDVVEAFRAFGCTVLVLSMVGDGCPDLLVGITGPDVPFNLLVEVKDGMKSPSRRKLTKDQVKFLSSWRGAYAVVETLDDVRFVVNNVRRGSFCFLKSERLSRKLELVK